MSGIYRLQTKFREGNVYTPVCQSFCSHGGVYADTPQGRHPPDRQPPPPSRDGNHPTGINSCGYGFELFILLTVFVRATITVSDLESAGKLHKGSFTLVDFVCDVI